MTKQVFQPSVKEDLNRPHKVTLTEGQISTILYVLEGYIQGSDEYHFNDDFTRDVDKIFEELQGVVDTLEVLLHSQTSSKLLIFSNTLTIRGC